MAQSICSDMRISCVSWTGVCYDYGVVSIAVPSASIRSLNSWLRIHKDHQCTGCGGFSLKMVLLDSSMCRALEIKDGR